MPIAFGFADQLFRRWMASGHSPVFIPTPSAFLFFRTFGASIALRKSQQSALLKIKTQRRTINVVHFKYLYPKQAAHQQLLNLRKQAFSQITL